ncbi:MAG: PspC domain-containing protein [Chloroflexi bacterium]|nr:PspC domain-containing protein [Chloroflexota bacterium]
MDTTSSQHLHRSREDRVIFGVCGGLGHQFGIDPVLFRIGFALATLAGGIGVLAYLLLAFVMPASSSAAISGTDGLAANLASLRDDLATLGGSAGDGADRVGPTQEVRGRLIGGGALVGLGLLLLGNQFGWLAWWNWSLVWPIVLIGLGVILLLKRNA